MQRRIPLGYQVVNGNVVLETEKADIVRSVFHEYANGISMEEIAKRLTEQKVLNTKGEPSWFHSTVSWILGNRRYLGNDFYPKIVEPELFEQVQKKRNERYQEFGKDKQFNCINRKLVFSEKLECGFCGTMYRKYVKWSPNPNRKVQWTCQRSAKYMKRECKNIPLEDDQISQAFIQAVNQLITKKTRWKPKQNKKEDLQSFRILELTERIKELEENADYAEEEMRQAIFERAKVQYSIAEIDDSQYQNEKLQAAIAEREPLWEFDEEIFKAIVQKIIVNDNGVLKIQFINGLEIVVPVGILREEESECRQ